MKRIRRFLQSISQNLVVKGTLILTVTGLATRIIGFYNRIFLSRLIGAKELGIYQLIFPLYMVAFSVTTFGNELALTKLVSEYHSRRDRASAMSLLKICFFYNLILALAVAGLIYTQADWLCLHVLNAPECAACLKVICLGVPFMAMKGAIHGYFLGLKQSGVHGVSDFLEQIAKVSGLYLLSGTICIRAQYDAAFAVWGIVIGELVSLLYSIAALFLHCKKNGRRKNQNRTDNRPVYTERLLRLFLKNAIPFTTNRLTLTLLQSIEAIMIPTILLSYYGSSTMSLEAYGVFSGMAFPFIMFPSTVTNSLSTMLMPAVSSASSELNRGYLKRLCEKSLHFCLLVGLFSTFVFYLFGPAIGDCFFHSPEAGRFLLKLSVLCPLIYLATTLASILNGLGLATHNLILTVLSTILRIGFILAAVPRLGMTGYIIGLFVSYLFQTMASLHRIQRLIPVELQFQKSILRPSITFALLGIASHSLFATLQAAFPSAPRMLFLMASIGLFGAAGLVPLLTLQSLTIGATTSTQVSGVSFDSQRRDICERRSLVSRQRRRTYTRGS